MKAANSAATRTGSWSPAKQDFANRVTTVASKAGAVSNVKSQSDSLSSTHSFIKKDK
jgi:hypothetical protein